MGRRGKGGGEGWRRVVAREKIGTGNERAAAARCGTAAAGREGPAGGGEGVAFITRARVSRL